MSAAPRQYSYIPAPHERAYYGLLFQAADEERTGNIGGTKAVTFFTRSKVPITILKDIWTLSDQPPTNTLDPMKFAVAIRFIQCEQNGIPIASISSPDMTQGIPPNLRPVMIDGIPIPPMPASGPSQPPPPQQQQQQQQQQQLPPRPPVMSGGIPPVATQHQQQHSNVPSMGDSVSVAGGGSASGYGNQQLAVQDPYMVSPSEQARYEQLFPDYVKEDPARMYMTGGEAVALFNKSGLSQSILAQIWNMVDTDPVDNKLDIIEFVLAMHLIVCVSKKNLPVPPALPLSLKNLKNTIKQQQQQQNHPIPQTIYQPHPVPSHPPVSMNHTNQQIMTDHNTGTMGFHEPPPAPIATNMAAPTTTVSSNQSLSGLPGPPPITKQGVTSISDAFEGLDGVGTGGYSSNTMMMGGSHTMMTSHGIGDTGSISSYQAASPTVTPIASTLDIPEPTPAMYSANVTTKPIPSMSNHTDTNANKDYVASYDMGENASELKKLRDALQKLQAENISLKATMGTLSMEEQDIQKELNATISEVTKLSNELTKSRAQVLASKSRLLEATAELKAAKEKTTVLKDLISDANATKQAIDEAHESIENANEVLSRSTAIGTMSTIQSPPVPIVSEEDFFGGWGDDNTGAVNAPLPGLGSGNFTSASSTEEPPQTYYANDAAPTMFEENKPNVSSSDTPTYNFNIQPAPASTNMYNGGGYLGGGHNRDVSGNDYGEVMGSGPTLQLSSSPPTLMQQFNSDGYGPSMTVQSTYSSIGNGTSMKEVEDLKAKSKEADDVAKEAEVSRKQLVAQLDELRKLADEAESLARAASEKPTKKKGILGRGGVQKKDAKEIERLMMDARDKKDALLQAQAQVKDAESLAVATKREAERLNKEAEDAQMAAAAAASMQDQNHQKVTMSSQQSPRYEIPISGGMPSMQVYDNPGVTGIDYTNPF